MRVLMTYLETESRIEPGHDGACEVADIAAQLSRLGIDVTVATAGQRVRFPSQNPGPFHLIRSPLLRVMPVSWLSTSPLSGTRTKEAPLGRSL